MGGIKELLSKNKNFIFHPKEDSLTDLIKKIILNKDFLGEFNNKKSLLSLIKIIPADTSSFISIYLFFVFVFEMS